VTDLHGFVVDPGPDHYSGPRTGPVIEGKLNGFTGCVFLPAGGRILPHFSTRTVAENVGKLAIIVPNSTEAATEILKLVFIGLFLSMVDRAIDRPAIEGSFSGCIWFK
jgi:hypothetical protein